MKLADLRAACVGKRDDQIDALIKSTDEYQNALHDGGGGNAPAVFAAGILVARGDQPEQNKGSLTRNVLWQITEQGMVAAAADSFVTNHVVWTWVPSGPFKELLQPGRNDSFVGFLVDGTMLKLVDPRTTMNCWEALIVAAIQADVIGNGSSLITLYESGYGPFNTRLTQALVTVAGRDYRPGRLLATPVRGDIVLFEGLNHVAIATGVHDNLGTEVLSFWPAPAIKIGEFGKNGTQTAMLRTTIEAIGGWMTTNMSDSNPPRVTFGSPHWPLLNQL